MQPPRLRLALALPVAQVIGAAILEHYTPPPDLEAPLPLARQVCWGMNAPALLVRGVGLMISDLVPPGGHPNGVSEVCFLAGVFLSWYLVGRALDRRSVGFPVVSSGRKGYVFLGSLFVLGLILCVEALGEGVRHAGHATFAFLLGVWALVLMVGSVIGLAARIQRETPES
jgi:hypothetical protein